jgi:hypothetical protein
MTHEKMKALSVRMAEQSVTRKLLEMLVEPAAAAERVAQYKAKQTPEWQREETAMFGALATLEELRGSLSGADLAHEIIDLVSNLEGLQLSTISGANWEVVEGAWYDVATARLQGRATI